MKYAFFFLFIFTKIVFCSDANVLYVNSKKNISVKVLLKGNDSLVVSVLDAGKQVNIENVDVSSGKKNHITFEDYNRDGYKDFSIWHLDEGMGTYKIYRLFIFSPPDKNFKEIKPTCGDDFVNLRIEGHDLINMIYDDNIPKPCSIPLKSLK
ncbi:XAC2610-related protein [Pseudocitrobacter faecalis]|uniref:XAC2610-related protein n=1 Tax=Pseudocitrobacter faecalis TaxID=1398493 RepID=UPI00331491A3